GELCNLKSYCWQTERSIDNFLPKDNTDNNNVLCLLEPFDQSIVDKLDDSFDNLCKFRRLALINHPNIDNEVTWPEGFDPASCGNALREDISYQTEWEPGITLFPNPTQEMLFINFGELVEDPIVDILIVNLNGQEVLNRTVIVEKDYPAELNISTFTKGMYQVVIKGQNTHVVEKFIVK
ncbi:MAG: T9SS type A sorting domain-containing protein, partial [Bacteroidota bacterium]